MPDASNSDGGAGALLQAQLAQRGTSGSSGGGQGGVVGGTGGGQGSFMGGAGFAAGSGPLGLLAIDHQGAAFNPKNLAPIKGEANIGSPFGFLFNKPQRKPTILDDLLGRLRGDGPMKLWNAEGLQAYTPQPTGISAPAPVSQASLGTLAPAATPMAAPIARGGSSNDQGVG